MGRNRWDCRKFFCFALLCMAGIGSSNVNVQAAGLELESESVKVGRQVSFIGNMEGYTFKSSDEDIAYISRDGMITGKKQGETTIIAKKSGSRKKYKLIVKANGNKPVIKVCTDEVSIGQPEAVVRDGVNSAAFTVQNRSENGVVKKGKFSFLCKVLCKDTAKEPPEEKEDTNVPGQETERGVFSGEDGKPDTEDKLILKEKTISVSFGKIQPGAEITVFYKKLKGLEEIQEAELQSVTVYSGEAKLKYAVETDTLFYGWGTEDKEAPVIRGFVGKKGYNGNDVYIILYKDRKTAYKKYITAYDERDGKVPVKADFSEVDWNRKGTYMIPVTAKDKAGNTAKKKMKVQVRCLSGVDLYADSILKKITKPGWSDLAKCKAIYSYVKSHMRYVNYNGGKSWESAALRALRYGNGNCYAYYGFARCLLTRAGIPNIMITRYPALPNHHHWWNLAYVKGGWYHFDTTPRRAGGYFCLMTDAQLAVYERSHPGTFRYSGNAYPKRATKVICKGP